MNYNDIQIPSNKKFGYFFSFIFVITAFYLIFNGNKNAGSTLLFAALIFLVITLFKAELLMLPNKLWMLFGLCLGKITTPRGICCVQTLSKRRFGVRARRRL